MHRIISLSLSFWTLFFGLISLAPSSAQASFGLYNSGGYYTADSGAGLVFKVKQSNGDISSLQYNGVEYQDPAKGSHINSGLGSATVTGALWGSQTIKIEVVAGTLTHYYMMRKNQNHIFMGTYFTEEPSIGLVRFIVRIPSAKLPNGPTNSDIRNNSGAIEASDVFGLANGQTRSKHYSDHRLIDFSYTGATGNGVGVWMVRSNHEGGSGGPFYRTIDNQCGDDQEIYEIINYGEGQTEPFRLGVFNGPYVLTFTGGAAPTTPIDTSWIHSTGIDATLKGWVQNRGTVSGQTSGIAGDFQTVVGFANASAQYWCIAQDGSFSSPAMIPGDYTMTLYKGELAVATQSVSVAANANTSQNIASGEIVPFQRFRIGEWDGTPAGFLNADKVTAMHPADVRMSAWGPVTYTVGTNTASDFPAYQWKDVNNATAIKFNLNPGEVSNHTLRVGLTCAYAGARPQISVNNWNSSIPSPSSQPSSRTLTVGTYRGNNVTYSYNIPASAFVVGINTLYLSVVSGSGASGFLSAGYSYDCVELDAPYNGAFRLTPQNAPDKSLAVLDSNPANGAQTVISAYHRAPNQQFLLDQQSDGSYRIRTLLEGNRCVELPFGDASDGTPVKLWDDNGNSAQRWNLVPKIGDWLQIAPKNDASKCMDVNGGPAATAEGTLVQSYTFNGLSNQLWKLTPALPNSAPLAQNDAYTLNQNSTLTVAAASGVLSNDSDAQNDALSASVVENPAHGTLDLSASGAFSYVADAGFVGNDSFTYQISDGDAQSAVATVDLTILQTNAAPQSLSLNPADGTSNSSVARTLSLVYSDADGNADIAQARVIVGAGPNAGGGLYGFYDAQANKLYLYNDSGSSISKGYTPGSNATIGNSQGTLNCRDTTVSKSGNTLTVNWNFTPNGFYLGAKNIYSFVSDQSGARESFKVMGSWTIALNPGNDKPLVKGLAPNSVSSPASEARALTMTYADPDGVGDIAQARILINPAARKTDGIYGFYDAKTNKLYLYDNAGTSLLGGYAPGSANTISNAQGSLNCAQTTVSKNGDELVVSWNITPRNSFAGSKPIYGYVRDAANVADGFRGLGNWKITPGGGAISVQELSAERS